MEEDPEGGQDPHRVWAPVKMKMYEYTRMRVNIYVSAYVCTSVCFIYVYMDVCAHIYAYVFNIMTVLTRHGRKKLKTLRSDRSGLNYKVSFNFLV
jgi:hypothetical protein